MKHLLILVPLLATLTTAGAASAVDAGRNFNATLVPTGGAVPAGSGLVKFRQPEDANKIVYLKVRLSGLLPNHAYYLERATDTVVNDDCGAATNWLRLGAGLVPSAIATDDSGSGRSLLFRNLASVPEGMRFDIRFRVVDAVSETPVLLSDCYQFTVRQ
jgi:hypothetical protein